MSEEGRLFLEACGASGALRFEWIDPTTGELHRQEFEQPALVLGRDPTADLVLDDPSVAPYHAFLQLVDGRLFAIDLESGDGVRWGEIPRAAGWVNRGRPLRIGPFRVSLMGGDRDEAESKAEPAPTSSRYVSTRNPPGVVLEFRLTRSGKLYKNHRGVIDRVLVLGGNSERCKLKFEGDGVPKFATALIRTPNGLWMTNILPDSGATVNGAFCRFARLEDDDVIRSGPLSMRVIYGGASDASSFRALSRQENTDLVPVATRTDGGRRGQSFDEASPEILLRPLLEQASSEFGSASSPFGEALVLMVRLLGDVHKDHLSLVRDELAQIRHLNREMDKLRAEMGKSESRRATRSAPLISNGTDSKVDSIPPREAAPRPRPHPEAVKEMVGERLEAWERERQSRFRKLLRLLVQP